MSITKTTTAKSVKEFAQNEKDTGSTPIQVASLTAKIKHLTEHLKIHRKDFDCELSLTKMVNRRKKLLAYLKNKNEKSYLELIKKLGLRK